MGSKGIQALSITQQFHGRIFGHRRPTIRRHHLREGRPVSDTQVMTIGVVLIAVGLLLTQVAFAWMKTSHNKTWVLLGRPHLIRNNTPYHAMRWMRFLYGGEYRRVPDSRLRSLLLLLVCVNSAIIVWLIIMLYAIFFS